MCVMKIVRPPDGLPALTQPGHVSPIPVASAWLITASGTDEGDKKRDSDKNKPQHTCALLHNKGKHLQREFRTTHLRSRSPEQASV